MSNIRTNLIIIPTANIVPNPWNPNRQSDFIFEKELASITAHGFIDPILVREAGGEDGMAFEIIDGEHRWKAANVLGMIEVPAINLGVVDDASAKQMTILMNEVRGRADSGLMADLVKNLSNEVGIEAISALLPFTPLEIESMINSSEVDFSNLSTTTKDEGDSGPKMDTVRFTAPEWICERLRTQFDRIKELMKDEDNAPARALEAMCKAIEKTPDEELLARD